VARGHGVALEVAVIKDLTGMSRTELRNYRSTLKHKVTQLKKQATPLRRRLSELDDQIDRAKADVSVVERWINNKGGSQ
jgi:chaperonin cofactor prefoldin